MRPNFGLQTYWQMAYQPFAGLCVNLIVHAKWETLQLAKKTLEVKSTGRRLVCLVLHSQQKEFCGK